MVVLVCRPVPRPFTLVIVHWNQAEACARTLDRFAAQGTEVRALVVDNGSRPDQLEALREAVAARGGTRLVEQGHNSGFGPGANAGLRRWLADDDTEWCLLAPHDAEPAPDCLARLDRALAGEPLAGLACADVGDGMVPMLDPYFGGITRRATRSEGWEDADYPHGTLMALRRGCVEEIGLFEESYFAYCEEADLGRRALDAGWKIGIVHGARVTNTHLGTSVAAVDYLMERNTLRMVRDHSGRYHAFIRFVISLLHLWSGWRNPEDRPPVFSAPARRRALVDFVRGRTGPPPADLYIR